MQKSSTLFLLVIAATAALGAYEALFPLSADIAFIRFLGLDAFVLLCVSLMIGPLAVIDAKFAQLIEPRRSVGLAAFALVVAHLLLSTALEFGWNIAAMLSLFPISVSAVATIIFTALAFTSCDYAVKKLGQEAWKAVQSLNYAAFPLSFAHFILQANGLFVQAGGKTFLNLAEAFAILMGLAAIALQAWGFALRRSRQAKSKEQRQPPAAGNQLGSQGKLAEKAQAQNFPENR